MFKTRNFSVAAFFVFLFCLTFLLQPNAYSRTSLSQLQAQITALQNQVDALEGQVDVDVSDLQAQIDVLQAQVDAISAGQIKAYSATGEELGIFSGFSMPPYFSSWTNNRCPDVFIPSLQRFFQFYIIAGTGGNTYSMDEFYPKYFGAEGCIGTDEGVYIQYASNTTIPEHYDGFHSVVTLYGDQYILEEITEPVVIKCVYGITGGRQPCVDNCVLNVGEGYYKFVKVTLPFDYPVNLPVRFE